MVRSHLYDWLPPDLSTGVRRNAEYSGDLLLPIPDLKPRAQISEAQRRLDLLFDCLAIPRGDFEQLAIALACRHVPGFRPTRRRVATSTRSPRAVQGRLQRKVRLLLAKRGVTNKPRRAGRPAVFSTLDQEKLVAIADDWHKERRGRSAVRTTDADFVRSRAKALAKREGISERTAIHRLANRLSRARRLLSKPLA